MSYRVYSVQVLIANLSIPSIRLLSRHFLASPCSRAGRLHTCRTAAFNTRANALKMSTERPHCRSTIHDMSRARWRPPQPYISRSVWAAASLRNEQRPKPPTRFRHLPLLSQNTGYLFTPFAAARPWEALYLVTSDCRYVSLLSD